MVTEKGIKDRVRNLIVMGLVTQAKLLNIALAVEMDTHYAGEEMELDQDMLSLLQWVDVV